MWMNLTEKWRKLTKSGKALVIVIAAVVVILLVFFFIPILRVSYAEEESYTATETYYVREGYVEDDFYTILEPYTDIEVYCDEEPCSEYIPVDYVIVGVEGHNYFESDGSPACSVEVDIQNMDEIGGVFTVEFLITVYGNENKVISGSKDIEPGTMRKVIAYYNEPLVTLDSFTFSVHAPEKPDPSYREEEVTKYREVTEYGEVTKYRYDPVELTVVKTRTVTAYKRVSLLSYLINY